MQQIVIEGTVYQVDESKKLLIDEVECFPLGGGMWAFMVPPGQSWQKCYRRPDESQGPGVPSAIKMVREFGAKGVNLPWSVWYRNKLTQRAYNNVKGTSV